MTTTPPPIDFVHHYEAPEPPAPRSPRGPRAGTVVAWVVIFACAAALVVRPRWLDRAAASPTTRPTLPSLAETRSPQVELLGRYAVGVKNLMGGQGVPTADLIGRVEDAATSPVDELRAIAVAGELAGGKAALERLDGLEKRHPIVRLRPDVDALRRLYTDGPAKLDPRQRELLVTNHRWFGQLALSHDLPATDPARVAALRPAGRTVLAMGAATFLGLGALFTGVVLLILAIVLAVKGRLPRAYRPPAPPLAGPLVEAFALYLFVMVAGSQVLGRLFPGGGLWPNFALALLLPLALAYLRLRGAAWGDVRDALGLHRGRGFWRELGVGIIGYLGGLPVLAVGAVVTFVLMRLTGSTASHPITNQPLDRGQDVLGVVLLAVVLAPVLEEILFRGAFFSHLRAYVPWWVAAPVVSLLFAAIHPQGWVAIPALGAIAMVFAALREWRGSIVAPVVAHAINNGVAVTLMLLLLR